MSYATTGAAVNSVTVPRVSLQMIEDTYSQNAYPWVVLHIHEF